MKTFKIVLVAMTLFIGAFALSSCGDTTEQKGKEYTSAYICPMHCEGSGSEEAGTCPVCGMDYKKNEMEMDDHSGHDH